MKNFLIVSLVGISSLCNAQYNLKGKIADASTNKAIEYPIIYKEGTNVGCIADSAGNFSLVNLMEVPDSLLVSCIGYERKHLYKKDLVKAQAILVLLKPTATQLKEVVIKPLTKSLWLGGKRQTNNRVPLRYSCQEMRYFACPQKGSYLKTFRFYLEELCGENPKVRIRVYHADTVKNIPANDLLQANLIKTGLKKGWNEVDLSAYNLPVPSSGFFIGLEQIREKSSCCAERAHSDQKIVTYHDVVIGCTKEPTLAATKSTFWFDYETAGELKPRGLQGNWDIMKLKGFDLLYRVEVMVRR